MAAGKQLASALTGTRFLLALSTGSPVPLSVLACGSLPRSQRQHVSHSAALHPLPLALPLSCLQGRKPRRSDPPGSSALRSMPSVRLQSPVFHVGSIVTEFQAGVLMSLTGGHRSHPHSWGGGEQELCRCLASCAGPLCWAWAFLEGTCKKLLTSPSAPL